MAADTGSAVYIVHLSSAAALDHCRQARAAGLPIYVETRPLYLHLTRSRFTEPDAAKYVGAPPLREQADRDALWRGLAAGDIDTLCSDHAPWTLDAKLDPALDVMTARQGVADLETLMPMLFSEGVVTGRITLDQFVALTSARAARLFGLYPRKGTIAVGSDADLTLWDPGAQRVINGAAMASRAGYSVYDGWVVTGWPRFVASVAASRCWPTASAQPSPARVSGCAATRRPPAPRAPPRRRQTPASSRPAGQIHPPARTRARRCSNSAPPSPASRRVPPRR